MSKDLLSFGANSDVSAFVIGNKLQSMRTALSLGDKPELAALYKMQDAGTTDISTKASPKLIDPAILTATTASLA